MGAFKITLAVAILLLLCANLFWTWQKPKLTDAPANQEDWVGDYASPEEIAGYSGTFLWIEKPLLSSDRDLSFTMHFYTDVGGAESPIDNHNWTGTTLINSDTLYLGSGYAGFSIGKDRKPPMHYNVTRYRRVLINGRTVLMRDDAFEAYRQRNELYDYGILIRKFPHPVPPREEPPEGDDWTPNEWEQASQVHDEAEERERYRRESIKILYENPDHEWNDPFVHGPNKR